jgi:hypothetical protein
MKRSKSSTGRPKRAVPNGVVYVIEIAPKWHGQISREPRRGKAVLYVGETGRALRERLDEHLTGKSLPGRKKKASVRPIGRMLHTNGGMPLIEGVDLIVRHDLAAPFNTVPLVSSADNHRAERRAAKELRKQGHIVYSNGLKKRKSQAKAAAETGAAAR